MKISDRIIAVAGQLAPAKSALEGLQKQLTENQAKIEALPDDSPDLEVLLDEADTIGGEMEKQMPLVEDLEKKLESLRKAEQRLAGANAKPPVSDKAPAIIGNYKTNHKPGDTLIRCGVVKALAHLQRRSEGEVLQELYGEDEATKAVASVMLKTAVTSATTTVTGWAAELVQADIRGLLEEVESQSVAAALALAAERSGGMRIDFGMAGSVTVPKINPTGKTPTEPAWVGEGGAIPLMQFSFGGATLNRYKLAGIVASTMELQEQSTYAIEQIFRRGMQKAYIRVLDNAFLSTVAAVPGVRPAGLLNGLAGANTGGGTAGGGVDSVRQDLSNMLGAILANNEGAVPMLVLNNQDRMNLSFVTTAMGDFVFRDDLASGRVLNLPVVSSGNVPVKTAIMVDVSSLATAFDGPEYRISQEATVVFANADGTAPTMADDTGTAGASGAVGTPGQVPVDGGQEVAGDGQPTGTAGAGYIARSAYQQYLELIRAIWPTSFIMMRTGVVAQRTGITWNT
jgi:HK97 family phage major capsid protein